MSGQLRAAYTNVRDTLAAHHAEFDEIVKETIYTTDMDALLKAYPKAGERKMLVDGLKLTLPLYHTDETKDLPPFKVSPQNFANSVSMLVEYAGVNKSAGDRPQDFYTIQYLPK